MHHANLIGLIHSQRVCMMHQCIAGKTLASAMLFKTSNEHEALRHHAIIKGLTLIHIEFFVGAYKALDSLVCGFLGDLFGDVQVVGGQLLEVGLCCQHLLLPLLGEGERECNAL